MARIRARFSRRSKYYVPKHIFMLVYHYCLNYNDWKAEHDTRIGLCRGSGDNSGGVGDPTAAQAIRLADLYERIALIEQTAQDVEPSLHPWLLRYVTTEALTFDRLKAEGMPCERKMFYDRRRKFYWLMSQRLKL